MNDGDDTRHVVVSGQTLAIKNVKRLATTLSKCDDDSLAACLFMVATSYLLLPPITVLMQDNTSFIDEFRRLSDRGQTLRMHCIFSKNFSQSTHDTLTTKSALVRIILRLNAFNHLLVVLKRCLES